MKFKAGDRVECESEKTGATPRWNDNIDCNGSGAYIQGIVTIRRPTSLVVMFDNGTTWEWPLVGHLSYHSSQWSYPGYLRRIEEGTETRGKGNYIIVPGKFRLIDEHGYTRTEKVK